MSEDASILDRTQLWKPPPRPDWVAKVNQEGAYLDIKGIIPLDEDSLLRTAMQNTGLSDFGEDSWRPHFRFILKAMEEEADYNFLGRVTARAHLLNILEGRLRIEEEYRKHPEIEDEKIVQPMFVIGQGRSGTSALQNILSSDPENGMLACWEAMYPSPPPEAATYRSDPRIEVADKFITHWMRIVPETGSVHEWTGDIPVECVQITSYSFLSQWFILLGQITSYVEYMNKADWRPAYAYHKRVLKLLQWKNPRKRWLLKSPTHMPHLALLLETYPDALLVWPHRDPVKALASNVSLAGNRNWVTSDKPRVTGYEQYTDPNRASATLTRVTAQVRDGVIPKDRLCNVAYADIVSDPLKVVQQVYDFFGLPFSEVSRRNIQKYVDENPREARPAHRYAVGTDEMISNERKLFKAYTDYFDVPEEI